MEKHEVLNQIEPILKKIPAILVREDSNAEIELETLCHSESSKISIATFSEVIKLVILK